MSSSHTPQYKDRSHADSAPSSRGGHGTVSGLPVNTVEPRKKHPGNVYPVVMGNSASAELPEDRITDEERAEVIERKKTERSINAMTPRPTLKLSSARGVEQVPSSERLNFGEMATVENAFKGALDALENTSESTVFYTDDASDVRLRVMKFRWVVEKYDPATGKGGKGLCYGETEPKQVRKSGRLGNFFPVGQGI